MAAPDPNARPREGYRHTENEIDNAHQMIEKCLQLYMDRNETASTLELYFRIDRHLTRIVWDRLEECNQEFFQDYYTRLELKRQISRFNELLVQQFQAMNFPLEPVEQQMSMELAETAPQADSPVSITNDENEAESHKLPANPVGSVKLEEVAGSDPNLVPCGSLVQSPFEGQGARINADAADVPISQVPNLIAGGHNSANFRGHFRPSSSRARSLSPSNPNPEASDQKDRANSPSDQGSPSADL